MFQGENEGDAEAEAYGRLSGTDVEYGKNHRGRREERDVAADDERVYNDGGKGRQPDVRHLRRGARGGVGRRASENYIYRAVASHHIRDETADEEPRRGLRQAEGQQRKRLRYAELHGAERYRRERESEHRIKRGDHRRKSDVADAERRYAFHGYILYY